LSCERSRNPAYPASDVPEYSGIEKFDGMKAMVVGASISHDRGRMLNLANVAYGQASSKIVLFRRICRIRPKTNVRNQIDR
jgi:hypothetical protein